MQKKLQKLFNDKYFRVVFGLFVSGVFLRFYKLSEFVTFLGDQGRDAIIIRRILTLEHLPAIGATTSIGQIYLGPFYYYFIAPWLLIANFNPIGLAIGVAFFSSFFVLIAYFLAKELFDKNVGLVFTALIAFSSILVDFSRYSWNPNLLPLFTFITLYLVIKAVKTKKILFFVLAGAFLSFSVQLHYIALCLVPAAGLYMIVEVLRTRPKLHTTIKNWVAMGISFTIFSSPLIVFDLRHQFLNSKNFLALFLESGAVGSHGIIDIISTFARLVQISFTLELASLYVIIFLVLVVIIGILFLKKNENTRGLSIFFFISLLITSAYSGVKHPHYLGVLYPLFYLMLAYILTHAFSIKKQWIALALFLLLFVVAQSRGYMFFFQSGGYQIRKAQNVARVVYDKIDKNVYQITGLPDKYSDSSYRYFLELWGRRPLEHDSLDRAQELVVLCERECKIIGDPQWEVAFFAPTKVVGSWQTEGVWIYKLTH